MQKVYILSNMLLLHLMAPKEGGKGQLVSVTDGRIVVREERGIRPEIRSDEVRRNSPIPHTYTAMPTKIPASGRAMTTPVRGANSVPD